MINTVKEVNFDGLVGPTHLYSGLSHGNLASKKNKGDLASPKQAALQSIKKMQMMLDLGLIQAVLPPQRRPNLDLLKNLGFSGSDSQIIDKAFKSAPELLSMVYSASSMWSANAATVSPSCNTSDQKLHITPANLISHIHRGQEAKFIYNVLKQIFANKKYFAVHEPLPAMLPFSDEGAANHNVICNNHGERGLEFFVYGERQKDSIFLPRQGIKASEAIIRRHNLLDNFKLGLQNSKAIDKGVFHNDVICTVNENVILYHEEAFANKNIINEIIEDLDFEIYPICVKSSELKVEEAVKSYLFNSQIITVSNNPKKMLIIIPSESYEDPATKRVLEKIILQNNPISDYKVVDCRQSMKNGGGPACLRLRIALNSEELSNVSGKVLLNQEICARLIGWVSKHYRDELSFYDLRDPCLITEVNAALDELTDILNLRF